jgi:ornithine cyclodeaminase/alanine dehydrogenase-like protein (mu-crystallin family)
VYQSYAGGAFGFGKGRGASSSETRDELPDKKGMLGMMPAYPGGKPPVFGIKVVSVFPGNHGTKFNSHQGTIQLFETEHGKLDAIIDAGSVTAIRTAAVSGVTPDLLARKKDIRRLAILGPVRRPENTWKLCSLSEIRSRR